MLVYVLYVFRRFVFFPFETPAGSNFQICTSFFMSEGLCESAGLCESEVYLIP